MDTLDELATLDALKRLAGRDGWLYRLDPRAKLLAALAFCSALLSVPLESPGPLLPLGLLLLLACGAAEYSPLCLLRRCRPAMGLSLALGLPEPWLHRELLALGPWTLGAGWLHLLALPVKAGLGVGAALLLVELCPLPELCSAVQRLGAPKAFGQALLLLWRYASLLGQEALRLRRARDLRDPERLSRGWRSSAQLLGNLLGRSLERAERVQAAMLSRAWRGESPPACAGRFGAPESLFLAAALGCLLAARFLPLGSLLGSA